jgi:uncharacterized protein RhaS with RHS repeats
VEQLNRNGFRDYLPALVRYAEPDPLGGLGSGINLHVYVDDNPTNSIDPLGLCPKCQRQNKGKGRQGLQNEELKHKAVTGNQHSNPWEINWSLTHNTITGGRIVQYMWRILELRSLPPAAMPTSDADRRRTRGMLGR